MSETWTSLLSGVVGAIVGGAASLAGTMFVNKQQMATNARMRLYDELLPKVADRVYSILDERFDPLSAHKAEQQLPELLEVVRRASAIAGPFERKSAHNLWLLWEEHAVWVERKDAPRPKPVKAPIDLLGYPRTAPTSAPQATRRVSDLLGPSRSKARLTLLAR